MQVTDGDGRVLVTAVGPRSEWGMIMDKVTVEEESETPLQQKLGTCLHSHHKPPDHASTGLVATFQVIIGEVLLPIASICALDHFCSPYALCAHVQMQLDMVTLHDTFCSALLHSQMPSACTFAKLLNRTMLNVCNMCTRHCLPCLNFSACEKRNPDGHM